MRLYKKRAWHQSPITIWGVFATCKGFSYHSCLYQTHMCIGGQAVEMNILQTVLLKFNREYLVRKTGKFK